MQVSRNRLSRTDPRGHSSRVFFRYVKRARTARHRSFNETEVSSPASPRSRYFPHHSYPHHLRLSRRQPYPPFRRRSPAAGSVSRKRSELAILFTLEVTPLYRVSIGFNPVDAPPVNSIFAVIIVTTFNHLLFHYFSIANLRTVNVE